MAMTTGLTNTFACFGTIRFAWAFTTWKRNSNRTYWTASIDHLLSQWHGIIRFSLKRIRISTRWRLYVIDPPEHHCIYRRLLSLCERTMEKGGMMYSIFQPRRDGGACTFERGVRSSEDRNERICTTTPLFFLHISFIRQTPMIQ